MAPRIATTTDVDRQELDEFLRSRHRGILITSRSDGGVQASPVTCGLGPDGRILIATYPSRAKTANARRDPAVSIVVISDDWDGPWVQVDGTAEVTDVPEAVEGLADYFHCISGEHSDWDEYREAMVRQGKSLIAITPQRWGPIATGGFPPDLA
jgi:PPOX class probable F420-dependent enzyme